MEYHYAVCPSPIGEIHILASTRGVRAIGVGESRDEFYARHRQLKAETWCAVDGNHSLIGKVISSLNAYFESGVPFPEDIPLDLSGSPFQQKVWSALHVIPHGKTYSYGEIAAQVGSPKAARAVGSACGANPIPLLVPCHRVITSDGRLGGYGGGLHIKRKLLDLESSK
ncbi:MAG: methylated-DNA--[protein]-cysteine S-methyltransferase [bacterium]